MCCWAIVRCATRSVQAKSFLMKSHRGHTFPWIQKIEHRTIFLFSLPWSFEWFVFMNKRIKFKLFRSPPIILPRCLCLLLRCASASSVGEWKAKHLFSKNKFGEIEGPTRVFASRFLLLRLLGHSSWLIHRCRNGLDRRASNAGSLPAIESSRIDSSDKQTIKYFYEEPLYRRDSRV